MAKKYNSGERPLCLHRKSDCNQRDEDGRCKALSETGFNGDCPFYCSRKVRPGYEIEPTTYKKPN